MSNLITVGQRFPLFENNIEKLRNKDGSVFEAFSDNDGYLLTIFLNKPNEREKMLFHSPSVQLRLYEREQYILPLIRFGSSDFIFEMDFDPTLYKDARAFQFKETNNTLFIVLVDSSTMAVVGMRAGNLPLKMIQKCSKYWAKAFLETDYSRKHKEWYGQVQDNLFIRDVWDRALYAGKVGDTYNLDEIHYDA